MMDQHEGLGGCHGVSVVIGTVVHSDGVLVPMRILSTRSVVSNRSLDTHHN
jgi:hypothetical protein